MRCWPSLVEESRILLKLALPIFFAQLALTALGFIDTLMSGWVGTDDLAAIGLGSSLMLPVFIVSTGVLLAITPIVSRHSGADDRSAIHNVFSQGLWLSLPLGALSAWALIHMDWILALLELSPAVERLTTEYLYYIAFGLPGIALYQALRFFWEGLGVTLPTMWISFLALVVNIPLNALFIYGYGPVEPMGAAGCGVASAIVMWLMFAVGLLYVHRAQVTRSAVTLKAVVPPKWQGGIKELVNLGVPSALALLFEVSLFSFIALFIAKLGAVVIAGHQVAISFTSMAFMMPLSLAMAITVRAGRAYGQNSRAQLMVSLYTGIGMAAMIGISLSLMTFYWRDEIVSVYSEDPRVLQLAAALLIYAAYYQVFDAIQVACAGALRGLYDTKITMLVTFISYWLIGMAGGYLLAYTDWIVPQPMGVEGFWLGIVLGLLLAAVLLAWRLKRRVHAIFS